MQTARFYSYLSHRGQLHSDRCLLHRLDLIALWSDGLAQEVIVVSVFKKTPKLLIFPRLLGVGDSEEMILPHEPVTQAAVLHHGVLGPLHARALLVGHVELLVTDQELGPDILARVDPLLWHCADTSGDKPVLIGELEDSIFWHEWILCSGTVQIPVETNLY